jgi:hypothetical protein
LTPPAQGALPNFFTGEGIKTHKRMRLASFSTSSPSARHEHQQGGKRVGRDLAGPDLSAKVSPGRICLRTETHLEAFLRTQ